MRIPAFRPALRFVLPLLAIVDAACSAVAAPQSIQARFEKIEYMIPMRDGVKLYTAVYVPKTVPGKHPILMERTPYGSGPYGLAGFAIWGVDRKYLDAGNS